MPLACKAPGTGTSQGESKVRTLAMLGVLAIAAGVAYWLWFGRDTLTEADVQAFYAAQMEAGEALDAPALCAMISEDYLQRGTVWIEGRSRQMQQDREETCDGMTQLIGQMAQLRARSGGRFKPDSSQTIVSVDVAPDGSRAIVKTRSTLYIGALGMSSRSTDTVIKRRGRVMITGSQSINWMGVNR